MRLLIVSRALSGEGSTGVRQAVSPHFSSSAHKASWESECDTPALRPVALPLVRFGDQRLRPLATVLGPLWVPSHFAESMLSS